MEPGHSLRSEGRMCATPERPNSGQESPMFALNQGVFSVLALTFSNSVPSLLTSGILQCCSRREGVLCLRPEDDL